MLFEEIERLLEWLDASPDSNVEIVTNSALTSDNFFTQAVIDFETIPGLMLPEQWIEKGHAEEADAALVAHPEWRCAVEQQWLVLPDSAGHRTGVVLPGRASPAHAWHLRNPGLSSAAAIITNKNSKESPE